jgi:hypothetical protein
LLKNISASAIQAGYKNIGCLMISGLLRFVRNDEMELLTHFLFSHVSPFFFFFYMDINFFTDARKFLSK